MPNAYWNAHSDRDWEADCGIEDKLPCEMCESSSGNFCLVCGFEEGEDCPYDRPPVRDIHASLVDYAKAWESIFDQLFGDRR